LAKRALLFDLDGTLLDSDPLHAQVFIDLLAARGRRIDRAFYDANMHGRLNQDIFADLTPGEDPDAMSDMKEAEFRRRLGSSVAPTPGLAALLDRAAAGGWCTAVVTNAIRLNANAMLGAIGMGDRTDLIVASDDGLGAKPDPAPYVAAMARLGVAPGAAIAFEDSPAGLASARAAGATVFGLRTVLDDNALLAHGAHHTITDFTDPLLAQTLARFEGVPA